MQQAARDTLFPMTGMRSAVDRLAAIYAKAGIPDRFRGTFHDASHSFTPAMQEEAFAWLERWLRCMASVAELGGRETPECHGEAKWLIRAETLESFPLAL